MIAVIGDRETAIGFRLAGVQAVYEVSQNEEEKENETLNLLNKLVSEDGVVLIIINERLAAETRVRNKIRAINENKRGVTPIIVEIPDKRGPMEQKVSEIERLIKRAVGVALK
ncbi:V-type ATP synthase subunit F [Methanosarcinales archaeon]|nr:MAG: V-type ATP synthase subunit F [Methanosarcinales archaeon]